MVEATHLHVSPLCHVRGLSSAPSWYANIAETAQGLEDWASHDQGGAGGCGTFCADGVLVCWTPEPSRPGEAEVVHRIARPS